MQKVMTGVRPICLGLILGVLCSLALTNYASVSGGISLPALAIGAVALASLLKFKLSIPKTILLSAILGLLLVR